MKIINVDQEIMGGMPVFNGTRVPIQSFFDYIETGETVDDFLDGFPSVRREQVLGLLELTKRMLSASTLMFNESFA
jgi:uncharacterized protein (DUF433 family)